MRYALLILVACSSSPKPAPPAPSPQPSATEETFTGTLTDVNFGCAADGSCDFVVDGTKHVHFGHDTRGEQTHAEWGSAEELWPLMQQPDHGVGKHVEVFAAKTGDSYTIAGKAAYYVKVLP